MKDIVTPISKLVEQLDSAAPWGPKLFEAGREIWRGLANLTCGPVYGQYRETLFTPSGRKLKESSIIVVKPARNFVVFKSGIAMEGICTGRKRARRIFNSLKMAVWSKNPLSVEYSYLANERGHSFYNNGQIRFEIKVDGKFQHAEGYFDRKIEQGRTVRIYFVWERISSEEVRARTGKKSLKGFADICRFLRGDKAG